MWSSHAIFSTLLFCGKMNYCKVKDYWRQLVSTYIAKNLWQFLKKKHPFYIYIGLGVINICIFQKLLSNSFEKKNYPINKAEHFFFRESATAFFSLASCLQ